MSYKIKREDYISLSSYLNELKKVKILTREEERAQIIKGQQGDESAKNDVIRSNLRYVVKIALEYNYNNIPLQDLINEGNLGLINAFDKFDTSKNFVFISYAIWWVRQAILKALNEQRRLIRLPNNVLQLVTKLNRLRDSEEGEKGLEHFAKKLGTDERTLKNLYNITGEMASLENSSIDENLSLHEVLGDEKKMKPDQEFEMDELTREIGKSLEFLKAVEKTVIIYRFGLYEHSPLSLSELSRKLSLSKERIRQVEKRALEKLSENPNSSNLRSFTRGHL